MGRKLLPPFDPTKKWPTIITNDGCVEYKDKLYNPKTGYISIHFNGKNHLAHRAVWIFYNGTIALNNVIRHSCDNPRCLNIAHLSVGTQKVNIADAINKNRTARKGRHGLSKKVVDFETGNVFNSIIEAAEAIGVKEKTLSSYLTGQNPNKTNFKYYEQA